MTRSSLCGPPLGVLCAASFALLGAACTTGPATGGTGGAAGGPLSDVIYEGQASDEALAAMLAAMPVASPPEYAIFDSPMEAAELPASPIHEFAWHLATAGVDGGALAPPDGTAYYVVFESASDDKLLRVFTTKTTYEPDSAAWSKLGSAGSPIAGWILTGIFDDDRLAAGGGPFRGPWIAFVVKP